MTHAVSSFALAGEGADPTAAPPEGFLRRGIDLPVRQEMLRLVVDVAAGQPARLADIVPLVHGMDDRLMAVYLRHAREQHKEIFCRKGCSVCCERYLIVLSPAEMYFLMERLGGLPPERQRPVRDWLDRTAAKARRDGLIARLRNLGANDKPLDIVDLWWRQQEDTTCPFLEDGACGIYPVRFVACREYYSHASAEHCARRATSRMPVPLHLFNVLWRLEQELSGEPCGAIELPLMGPWWEVRAGESARTWSAPAMLEALFRILADTAAEAQALGGGAVVGRTESGGGHGGTAQRSV